MCLPNQFTSRQNIISVSTISTVFEKPATKLDVNNIRSSHDLDALRESDPFMYYSIPSVRKAAMHQQPVDISALTPPISDDNTVRMPKSRSCESQVTRQTRVSFECHTDLLFEDLAEFNSDIVNEHLRLDYNDDLFKNFLLSVKSLQ
ncbi:hypothetical protein HJC23_008484 [Cyclotella cryptica]|uniref:Uncharacterized protein n=1 Tax=Cyclotella cryptica TaxID=29204 RepID=A0ABD3QW45_9STRA